ncbi:hypothetical protein ACFC9I_06130 [Enterococcus casseliflavus]|uniref:hypothetical protein n=1 Tax=Enterococcus casseliflavus TaxID=37734 RepID=UPI0039A735F8
MNTFLEICKREGIDIPRDLRTNKRLQRFTTNYSVTFILDEASNALLDATLPFDTIQYNLKKKLAENIIIAHREKHRKTDESRLTLMEKEIYGGYRKESFYYQKKDDEI